jgi:hypothetical protein
MIELDDPFAHQLSLIEQETLGLARIVTYRYRCSR